MDVVVPPHEIKKWEKMLSSIGVTFDLVDTNDRVQVVMHIDAQSVASSFIRPCSALSAVPDESITLVSPSPATAQPVVVPDILIHHVAAFLKAQLDSVKEPQVVAGGSGPLKAARNAFGLGSTGQPCPSAHDGRLHLLLSLGDTRGDDSLNDSQRRIPLLPNPAGEHTPQRLCDACDELCAELLVPTSAASRRFAQVVAAICSARLPPAPPPTVPEVAAARTSSSATASTETDNGGALVPTSEADAGEMTKAAGGGSGSGETPPQLVYSDSMNGLMNGPIDGAPPRAHILMVGSGAMTMTLKEQFTSMGYKVTITEEHSLIGSGGGPSVGLEAPLINTAPPAAAAPRRARGRRARVTPRGARQIACRPPTLPSRSDATRG